MACGERWHGVKIAQTDPVLTPPYTTPVRRSCNVKKYGVTPNTPKIGEDDQSAQYMVYFELHSAKVLNCHPSPSDNACQIWVPLQNHSSLLYYPAYDFSSSRDW